MNTKSLRGYLFAGLVVWLPIIVTFFILRFIIEMLDEMVSLIPYSPHLEKWLGLHIPGVGILIAFVLVIITGVIATNILGQRIVGWGESLLARIPLVRSIYKASKQVIQAVFSSNSQAFRKVVLIQYPREGLWTLAFLTSAPEKTLCSAMGSTPDEMIAVFVPTTPNPTAGFLLMMPKSDAVFLDMSVDEAFKLIISMGVMPSNSLLSNA